MPEVVSGITEAILASEFTEAEREAAEKLLAKIEGENPYSEISFAVLGEAKAQPRTGQNVAVGGRVTRYDPEDARTWKRYIKNEASAQLPPGFVPVDGEIHVLILVYKRPPKMARARLALAEAGHIRPEKKPDWDNFAKAVTDALKGVVWTDDSRIVSGRTEKYYSMKPRVEVFIRFRRRREDK